MGAAHGDDHADLAQVEVADPVDDGGLDDRPALACSCSSSASFFSAISG